MTRSLRHSVRVQPDRRTVQIQLVILHAPPVRIIVTASMPQCENVLPSRNV